MTKFLSYLRLSQISKPVLACVGFGMGRRGLWIWAGLVLVSLIVSGVLSSLIADSRVDVGIDISGAIDEPPRLCTTNAGGELEVLDEMSSVRSVLARNRTTRFHGSVPRRSLAELKIVFDDEFRGTARRIFVASFLPEVFYRPGAYITPRSWTNSHERVTVLERLSQPGGEIELPPMSRVEQGGVPTFAALFALLLVFLALAALCIAGLKGLLLVLVRSSPGEMALAPFRPLTFVCFLLPMLLLWLFYLGSFYPANLSYDSVQQWEQAHGTAVFTNAHPLFHTLLIRFLTRIWDSVTIVALFQIAIMSLGLAYAFSVLARSSIPRAAVIIAFLAALLSPRNGFMAVILWKDVPYSVCCLALTAVFAHGILDRATRKRRSYWVVLAVLLALIPLLRHNGLLVLAGISLLLPFLFWQYRRRALVTVVGAAMLFAVTNVGFGTLFDVTADDHHFSRKNAIRLMVLMVRQDVPLTQQEHDQIDEWIDIEKRKKNYEWWELDRPKGSEILRWRSFDHDLLDQDIGEIKRLSLSISARYPSYLLRYALKKSTFPLTVFAEEERLVRTTHIGTSSMEDVKPAPLFEGGHELLRGMYQQTKEDGLIWLFWKTGWQLYLLIAMLGIAVWRTREWRWIYVGLPALLNTLSLIVSVAESHARLQFSLTLVTGFVCCVAFLPRRGPHRGGGG